MIDKTLFKALMPGLGRRAALLLADDNSKYKIGDQVKGKQIVMQIVTDADGASLPMTIKPAGAGFYEIKETIAPVFGGYTPTIICYEHDRENDTTRPVDLASFDFSCDKVADANGVPVAVVSSYFSTTRTDGVIPLPSAKHSITPAALTGSEYLGYKLTGVTAGWYSFYGYVEVAS